MWTYETAVDWKEGKIGKTRAAGKPTVEVATPPEFGGPENYWSPEELISSAVASCVMTSALFFFERGKIALRSYKSKATTTMGKGPAGLALTGMKITIDLKLEDPAQEEAARTAVQQAKKSCPLSNALTIPVEMELTISE